MRAVLSGVRMLKELARYVVRGALWWFPLVLLVISVAGLLALAVQAATPVVVYVLF